jgi:hypothetical protein
MFTPQQLKKRIHLRASRSEAEFLDLATDLSAFHKMASGPQFKETISSAGIKRRKAYYLIEIAEQLRPHMRSSTRLQRLGWTKCQVIGKQLSNFDFIELLEYAETHTAKQLEQYIQDRNSKPRTRCVLLYFTGSQYRDFERAALQFGAMKRGRGLAKKEAATIRMCRNVCAE